MSGRSRQGFGVRVAARRQAADSTQVRRHLGVQIPEEVGKVPVDNPHPVERPREPVDPGVAAAHQVGHAPTERSLHRQPRGRGAQSTSTPFRFDRGTGAAGQRSATRPPNLLRVPRSRNAAARPPPLRLTHPSTPPSSRSIVAVQQRVRRRIVHPGRSIEGPNTVEEHRRAVARAALDEGDRRVVRGRRRRRRQRRRPQHICLQDRRKAPWQRRIDDEAILGDRQRVAELPRQPSGDPRPFSPS